MRGIVPGLASPHPLGLDLPGLYHDDELVQRFLVAFDDAMAPIFCTLDNLDAYLDPRLAPTDFLAWLAGWVGLVLDEDWPLERQRAAVADAAGIYRWRGTARALAQAVSLYAGVEPEIVENGASDWSPRPDAPFPGGREPGLIVRVRVPDPSAVDHARLDAVVTAAKPAHVPHTLEVVSS